MVSWYYKLGTSLTLLTGVTFFGNSKLHEYRLRNQRNAVHQATLENKLEIETKLVDNKKIWKYRKQKATIESEKDRMIIKYSWCRKSMLHLGKTRQNRKIIIDYSPLGLDKDDVIIYQKGINAKKSESRFQFGNLIPAEQLRVLYEYDTLVESGYKKLN